MANTRKVVYGSVGNEEGAKTIFSSASTLGELKAQEPDVDLKSQGMKAWIKDASGGKGYGLEGDNAKLPDGDFTLFFLINKNDSGKES